MRLKSSLMWLCVALLACASPRPNDSSADAGMRDPQPGLMTPNVAGSVLRARDLTLHLGEETRVELADAAFTLGASKLSVLGRNRASAFGDRGALLDGAQPGEHFRVRDEEIEQYWTFTQEPAGDADVVIRVAVSGLSYAGDASDGLRFRASTGQLIAYSHAEFRDATSRVTHVPARFVNGAIEMVLARGLLSTSAYPAELDPVIRSPVLSLSVDVWSPPSIAYSAALDQYGITYAAGTTSTEDYIEAIRLDSSGARVDSTPFRLFTTTSLSWPKTAAAGRGFATAVYVFPPKSSSASGAPQCMTWNSDAGPSTSARLAEISSPFAVEPGTGDVIGYTSSHYFYSWSRPGIVRGKCGTTGTPKGLFELAENDIPYSLAVGADALAYWKYQEVITTTNTSNIALNRLDRAPGEVALIRGDNKRFLFFAAPWAVNAARLDDAAKPVGYVQFRRPGEDQTFTSDIEVAFDGHDFVIVARLGSNIVFKRVTPDLVATDPGWKKVATIGNSAEGSGFSAASDGKGRTVIAYTTRGSSGAKGLLTAIMLDRDASGGLTNGSACASGLECESGYCVDGVCCNTSCGFSKSSDCQACSVAAGAQVDGTCAYRNAQTECRASAGDCDVAEFCTGSSSECPIDDKRAKGSVCGPAATGPCDLDDVCDGVSATCRSEAREPSTKVCRASTDVCDAPELCNGTDSSCPADGVLDASVTCRDAAGPCDAREQCTGTSKTCPADARQPSGTVCRAAEDLCDAAESCDGRSSECGQDLVQPPGTSCRDKVSDCDEPDFCDGTSKICAALFAPAGTLCRSASGACDVDDVCTGTDGSCPASFAVKDTLCRPAASICDVAEVCSGDAPDCPQDAFASAQVTCREVAGPCDVKESCDGKGACPEDTFAPANQLCRAPQGICDVAEACTGLSADCTADLLHPKGLVCAVEGDVCGACDGVTHACGEERSEALCEGLGPRKSGGDSGCSIRAGSQRVPPFGPCLLCCLAIILRTLGVRRRESSQTSLSA